MFVFLLAARPILAVGKNANSSGRENQSIRIGLGVQSNPNVAVLWFEMRLQGVVAQNELANDIRLNW
jgi:hypothetical protein